MLDAPRTASTIGEPDDRIAFELKRMEVERARGQPGEVAKARQLRG